MTKTENPNVDVSEQAEPKTMGELMQATKFNYPGYRTIIYCEDDGYWCVYVKNIRFNRTDKLLYRGMDETLAVQTYFDNEKEPIR